MKHRSVSTRRSFFWTAGAALSATAASAVAGLSEQKARDEETPEARLARLEDTNAIRQLHQAYAKHLNARAYDEAVSLFTDDAEVQFARGVFVGKLHGIRRLYVEHFGGPLTAARPQPRHALLQSQTHQQDIVEIAADRRTAAARFHCTVQAEAAIAPGCPLVEMALQQGGGVIRWVEGGVFEHSCVREGEVWKIKQLAYHTVRPAYPSPDGSCATPSHMVPFTVIYPEHPAGPDRVLTAIGSVRSA